MRTYGTCKFEEGRWIFTVEAQVALRAKRVFPKLEARACTLALQDTLENCRELLWFMGRYPLKMDRDDKARLVCRADDFDLHLAHIEKVLAAPPATKRFKLAIEPRDYQWIATELVWHTKGLLSGDDVGLGKTLEAIAMMADPRCRPGLVVTLTHLPKQWQEQFAKFLPELKTHIITKGTPYEKPLEIPDVVIMNYHKMNGWAGALAGKFKSITFDEIHELRHNDSAKYRAASILAAGADFKFGLSATPIFNYGSEIINILNIIKPGALGSVNEFLQEWCGSGTSIRDPRAFGVFLREMGLMIRRTKKEVGRELPKLTIVPHTVEIDNKAINDIAGDVTKLAQIVMAPEGMGIDKMKAGAELDWKLREATGVAKAPFVAAFVRMLVENGEQVLVGAWHHKVYDILSQHLKDFNPVLFTGEQSPTQKQKALDEFKSGRSKVLLMSNRSGAGVDGLQYVCHTVVYAELDWAPAVHEQFTGRVDRDGQEFPVFAYYPVADSGSDPVISDVLGVKRAQLEGIRNLEDIPQNVDPNKVRRMAEEFLKQRKIKS